MHLLVVCIGSDHSNLVQIRPCGIHPWAQHRVDRVLACQDHNVARPFRCLGEKLCGLARRQRLCNLRHELPLAYASITAKQRDFATVQEPGGQLLAFFRRHVAQPPEHSSVLGQHIQHTPLSHGRGCGLCSECSILYRPLVSHLCLHGQLQQIRIENVIFFHVHIPPCPNKFLTMFSFQGTSPHFHRGAVCSAVQGQFASRLGHRPHTQGTLVGMSSSSGACRLCSPPWVHKHITPRRICPVVF